MPSKCRRCAQRHRWWPEIAVFPVVRENVGHWMIVGKMDLLCEERARPVPVGVPAGASAVNPVGGENERTESDA